MPKLSAKGMIIKHGTSATPTDALAQVKTIGFKQGDRELLDVTTHDSATTKDYIDSGLRDTPEISLQITYDPANAGHEAVRAAEAAGTTYYLTLVLPDAGAAQWALTGKVLSFDIPDRSPGDPLEATIRYKATSVDTFTQ